MLARPLVAVSTKAYFGVERTRRWVEQVAGLGPLAAAGGVELAVLPSFPTIESAAAVLAPAEVAWGAQDVAPSDAGAQTGEVPASTLRELGCQYVEVGHAERRARFGDDDATVRAKVRQVVAHGMVPLLCVGEPDRVGPEAAARWCVRQAADALEGAPGAEVVVAYEPVWAIGAEDAAPAPHVLHVAAALRAALEGRRARVVYGGAAAPGTATTLGAAVDGLFLGRFAHEVAALRAVVVEVGQLLAAAPAASPSTRGRRLS